MAKDKLIQQCDIYQEFKHELVAYVGFLQLLLVPEAPWKDASMEIIDGLQKSKGREVTVCLTKYAHLMPLAHPYTTITMDRHFCMWFSNCTWYQLQL